MCRGESFRVEYHIFNHEFLISISHVETFKFEEQSFIHFIYPCWVLPLRDSKDIHRSAKYEDQFVIADWRLLKVLTSDSNLLKTLKLFKSLNVNVHFLNTKKEDYILEISCEFYSSSFSIYRNPKISFKSSLNLNVYLGHPV